MEILVKKERIYQSILKHFLSAAALFPVLGVHAFGQIAATTSMVGTVTDASGKIIPNASITAVNTGTQDTYNTTTTGYGHYTVQFVRIGAYELTVRQPGFQTYKSTGIEVNINQVVRTDVVLRLGDLVQTITVDAAAPPIKTDDASVSYIINMRDVADLPLNGRSAQKPERRCTLWSGLTYRPMGSAFWFPS